MPLLTRSPRLGGEGRALGTHVSRWQPVDWGHSSLGLSLRLGQFKHSCDWGSPLSPPAHSVHGLTHTCTLTHHHRTHAHSTHGDVQGVQGERIKADPHPGGSPSCPKFLCSDGGYVNQTEGVAGRRRRKREEKDSGDDPKEKKTGTREGGCSPGPLPPSTGSGVPPRGSWGAC